jgi:hypothetical protein
MPSGKWQVDYRLRKIFTEGNEGNKGAYIRLYWIKIKNRSGVKR